MELTQALIAYPTVSRDDLTLVAFDSGPPRGNDRIVRVVALRSFTQREGLILS
ncbi:hypothetical protein [Dactylosporangium sp. NPDC050588]|uniref:hypothetical protein n=1 Tax=Dactylosporangium sp. NPDC050588 TaxID=3157211 RepID=UPI0033DC4C44